MSLTWRYLNSDAPRLILNDKVDFAAFCGEHGSPTRPILQHWEIRHPETRIVFAVAGQYV